jgi:hypothetical protein
MMECDGRGVTKSVCRDSTSSVFVQCTAFWYPVLIVFFSDPIFRQRLFLLFHCVFLFGLTIVYAFRL